MYGSILSSFEFCGKGIPEYMHRGILEYLENHRVSGDFLQAVFECDMRTACLYADYTNMELLHVYVAFLYNHAPAMAWGSKAAVKEWLSKEV